MGVIEGGTAVLFAIVIYGLFYGLAGAQVRKVLVADEEPGVRILGFFGIAFIALMVWACVGAFVHVGCLVWFRIWLREPHTWRQQILRVTDWFPFALLFKYRPLAGAQGGMRLLVILILFPITLLIAGGAVAIGLRLRGMTERAPMGTGRHIGSRGTA
jgi:hypothetical protein